MFKKGIIFFLFFIICKISFSQTSDTTEISYRFGTEDPVFPSGLGGIYEIIQTNLHYPELALKDRVGGIVYVRFIVDTLGNLENVKVLKGVREDVDKEAIRVISLLSGWKPGIYEAKKVKVPYTLPIMFCPYKKCKRCERKYKTRCIR